jgi:hypothetical protein
LLLPYHFIYCLFYSADTYTAITQARTPSPSKAGQQRASELETPQQQLDSESSEVYLSPSGVVSPSPPATITAAAMSDAAIASIEQPAAPATLWRLETTVGLASLSLLGSLLTSTCLKVEWHHLYATMSNSSTSATASGASSSERVPSPLAFMTTTAAWSQLSVHVMRPKDTGDFMESFTPFHAGMNGFFSTPQLSLGAGGLGPTLGPGSVLSGAAGGGGGGGKTGLNPLRPGVTPPSQIVPGIASAAGAGMKRRSSFSASVGAAGLAEEERLEHDLQEQETALPASGFDAAVARKEEEEQNMSPLLDAASGDSPSGTPSFADARSVMLSRFSGSTVGGGGGDSIISRHFSAHESELFEDAASELLLPDGSEIFYSVSIY